MPQAELERRSPSHCVRWSGRRVAEEEHEGLTLPIVTADVGPSVQPQLVQVSVATESAHQQHEPAHSPH